MTHIGRQVENTDVLIDGCLFEDCYASKKGGGMHQGVGQTSVLGSVFYNNSAGSDNIEDGEVSSLLVKCVPVTEVCIMVKLCRSHR